MSENDDFIKIFMHFNAKTAQKHIEFYMNNNYTIFRTFKEDGSCIEKSWVFWKHGKKMNTANLLFCRGQDRWGSQPRIGISVCPMPLTMSALIAPGAKPLLFNP